MVASPLTLGQRALLVQYCTDHPVASCATCRRALTLSELFEELWSLPRIRYDCPSCGADVADSLYAHISECRLIAQGGSTRTRQTIAGARRARKRWR